MKMSNAPITSAQASASDSITVFRAGTYVGGIALGSRPPLGTSPSPTSAEPPTEPRSTDSSRWAFAPSASAIFRAARISRAWRWPYLMVSVNRSNPDWLAMAAAVYESRPPLSRTTALDPPDIGAPDVLVDLQLKADRQPIFQNPLRQRFRIHHAVDRRAQHRRAAPLQCMPGDDIAR